MKQIGIFQKIVQRGERVRLSQKLKLEGTKGNIHIDEVIRCIL